MCNLYLHVALAKLCLHRVSNWSAAKRYIVVWSGMSYVFMVLRRPCRFRYTYVCSCVVSTVSSSRHGRRAAKLSFAQAAYRCIFKTNQPHGPTRDKTRHFFWSSTITQWFCACLLILGGLMLAGRRIYLHTNQTRILYTFTFQMNSYEYFWVGGSADRKYAVALSNFSGDTRCFCEYVAGSLTCHALSLFIMWNIWGWFYLKAMNHHLDFLNFTVNIAILRDFVQKICFYLGTCFFQFLGILKINH